MFGSPNGQDRESVCPAFARFLLVGSGQGSKEAGKLFFFARRAAAEEQKEGFAL